MRSLGRSLRNVTDLAGRHTAAWMVVGFALLAAVTGAVVSTGNIVLIALAIGAAGGLTLLGLPVITVTLIIVGTLVLSGPLVYYVTALDRLPWLFAMLGVLLSLSALLHGALARTTARGPVPGFVTIGIVFALYALASVLWAEGPLEDTVRGYKRILQYWGLLFALALIALPTAPIRLWIRLLIGIVFVQAPMAIYQRFVLIPNLEGAPIDAVVGTLELSEMATGASGILALMQLCAIGALLCAHRERLIGSAATAAGVFVLSIPILVGEVNAIFLWVPLMLLVIYGDLVRSNPLRFLTGGLAVSAALMVFGASYLMWQQTQLTPSGSLEDRIETVIGYNLGDRGYAKDDGLNRKTVWTYWWQRHGLNDPKGTLLGHGAGASFSAEQGRAEVNKRHGSQDLDLVALTSVLWDFGLVGFGLFAALFAGAARTAWQLVRRARTAADRGFARSLLCATALIASTLVYSNAVVLMPSQQVLAFLTLGLIAWRARLTAPEPSGRASPQSRNSAS